MEQYDCVIIGGGPAGLTAGIYARRAGMRTALLEGMFTGGQIITAHMVENYPGFPEGIGGYDFGQALEQQALRFGLEIINDSAEELELDGEYKRITASFTTMQARTVILCMGARPKPLGVEGEEKFSGRGVSYCATCDGNFFKGKAVAVVGGGDTACLDAMYLANVVEKVYLIHRRDQMRAAAQIADKVQEDGKVEILWNHVAEDIIGNAQMEGLRVRDVISGEERLLPVEGLFIAVGSNPATELVKDKLALTDDGYILTDQRMATSIPGVYAAGDIRNTPLRQVITAAADGAVAAMAANEYISLG